MTEVAVWLEASLVARVLRSGPWLYPLVNLAHLLGIALLVGAIAALDLRLVGLWPEAPTAALARATVPVAGAGLALALLTGPALLAVRATEYVENPFLWAKFGAVAVGLANLGALHALRGLAERRRGARRRPVPPLRARRGGVPRGLGRCRFGGADDRLLVRAAARLQNSSPLRSMPWTPFSPFTVCVTRKSTASEQSW